MTVGLFDTSQTNGLRGFTDRASSDDYGSLDDDAFTFDGTTYEIAIINDGPADNGKQVIAIAPTPSDNEAAAWTVHMSGNTYHLDEATAIVDDGSLRAYQFSNRGRIGWAENDEVAVSITAVPVVSIVAVTATVEYGGNNNAAESTAEFRFTRTGSTDDALSFSVGHIKQGVTPETLTRTFKAGQSSFSNFHWAIDVDNNGNPLCQVVWQISYDSHYIQGTPHIATVDVEGPGTTCMSGI
jgi:hypothetical protein